MRACRDLGLCAQERKTQARDGRGSENWGGLEMRCKSPEELAVHLKKMFSLALHTENNQLSTCTLESAQTAASQVYGRKRTREGRNISLSRGESELMWVVSQELGSRPQEAAVGLKRDSFTISKNKSCNRLTYIKNRNLCINDFNNQDNTKTKSKCNILFIPFG